MLHKFQEPDMKRSDLNGNNLIKSVVMKVFFSFFYVNFKELIWFSFSTKIQNVSFPLLQAILSNEEEVEKWLNFDEVALKEVSL